MVGSKTSSRGSKNVMYLAQAIHSSWHSMLRQLQHDGPSNQAAMSAKGGTEHVQSSVPGKTAHDTETCCGLTYLSPVVVTDSMCIYRTARTTDPEVPNHLIGKTHANIDVKPRGNRSIGWFELAVGPFVVSLNRF
jgi:hypothetical protein